LRQLTDSWFDADKIADTLDSFKRLRADAAHVVGLPTREEVARVEDLIARSQVKIQRLQTSVAKLEALLARERERRAPAAPAKAVKAAAARPTARKAKPSKIGRKSPSVLLEIDIEGKRKRR